MLSSFKMKYLHYIHTESKKLHLHMLYIRNSKRSLTSPECLGTRIYKGIVFSVSHKYAYACIRTFSNSVPLQEAFASEGKLDIRVNILL